MINYSSKLLRKKQNNLGKLKGHIESLKFKTNEERLRQKISIYSKGVGLRYQRDT